MAVYVDRPSHHWRDRLWCHLVADTLEELHAFAARLGLKRTWFQSESTPHYDITVALREHAETLILQFRELVGPSRLRRPTTVSYCCKGRTDMCMPPELTAGDADRKAAERPGYHGAVNAMPAPMARGRVSSVYRSMGGVRALTPRDYRVLLGR